MYLRSHLFWNVIRNSLIFWRSWDESQVYLRSHFKATEVVPPTIGKKCRFGPFSVIGIVQFWTGVPDPIFGPLKWGRLSDVSKGYPRSHFLECLEEFAHFRDHDMNIKCIWGVIFQECLEEFAQFWDHDMNLKSQFLWMSLGIRLFSRSWHESKVYLRSHSLGISRGIRSFLRSWDESKVYLKWI